MGVMKRSSSFIAAHASILSASNAPIGGSVVNATPRTFVANIAQDIVISAVFPPNGYIIKTIYWSLLTYHGAKCAITFKKEMFPYEQNIFPFIPT